MLMKHLILLFLCVSISANDSLFNLKITEIEELMRLDSVELALSLHKNLSIQYPQNYQLKILEIKLLNKRGSYEEALAKFEVVYNKDSLSDPSLRNIGGWLNYKVGNFEKSESFYLSALIDTTVLDTAMLIKLYNNIGTLYIEKKEYDKSRKCFKKAIDLGSELAPRKLKLLRIFKVNTPTAKANTEG